ncbi:MAG: DUF3093 domain-containing protein [Cryobacterium sp.]|nr:DUF3093 domain-containing protein [Cryobacterium sp.]MBX3103562.1 DUF3093 domain-containing protein [Cryobacterium sp.]
MAIYRERLWASLGIFVAVALVIPASLLVFLPINVEAGLIIGVVLFLVIAGLLLGSTAVIEVSESELKAGKALLPREFVGNVTSFREPEATVQRGTKLDARAWLLIRGWIHPVVKIEITDPSDPTPYWLISTRRPEELARALTAK